MIMPREFNTNMPSSIIGVVIHYCFCNDKLWPDLHHHPGRVTFFSTWTLCLRSTVQIHAGQYFVQYWVPRCICAYAVTITQDLWVHQRAIIRVSRDVQSSFFVIGWWNDKYLTTLMYFLLEDIMHMNRFKLLQSIHWLVNPFPAWRINIINKTSFWSK